MNENDIDERSMRIARLNELRSLGADPFPSGAHRTRSCHEAHIHFEDFAKTQERIVLAGRIRTIRKHGGSVFFSIQDGTDTFQIYVKKDDCVDKCFHVVKNILDIGDIIETEGTVFTTKTGEQTLHAVSCTVIAKALMPLPEQWHGLNDVEIRYRQRYLDLIANPEVRDIFLKRGAIVRALRRFFEDNRFLEVETPILQPIATGAAARPFVTHHHALHADMYLRVAPELYLKRLIIGGFERVYEFARCFRNEGIDHAHNPEFTQIEAYIAYVDYAYLMDFIEHMLIRVLSEVFTSECITYKGEQLDFHAPLPRMTYRECLMKFANIDIEKHREAADLRRAVSDRGIDCSIHASIAAQLDELFKVFARPNLIQPTFITEYPVELSPLAKKKSSDPFVTERFQLVAAGMEIVNGFSELNDPIDQAERFEQQKLNRELGDEETQSGDADFVAALEYGMPPTAGFGMGIDRLVALLTNSHNLKEVIFFPTLRPKK